MNGFGLDLRCSVLTTFRLIPAILDSLSTENDELEVLAEIL